MRLLSSPLQAHDFPPPSPSQRPSFLYSMCPLSNHIFPLQAYDFLIAIAEPVSRPE